ncbi:right-handed parallel beta-helix repeat-containing protein [Clostridium felsineum]|uniref:right-handed parallel beta-helix repeat-containing protein n=1 Tax=Clostridium felsineum TaxID=36839 RepID=UPI00214D3DE9|nr:right-handed parallel beta-helix repeat-containing protein [Clostridium felsineum]MCR3760667.1 right-handed parallel beta-helix repeat-containing protein [Clostridium felsineum]
MKKVVCLVASAMIAVSLASAGQLTGKVQAASVPQTIQVASTGTGDDSAVLAAAIAKAQPGDTIYLTSSAYQFKSPILLNKDGAAGNTIKLKSATTDKVKLDFSGEKDGDSSYGINIKNAYWELENIEVYSAGDNGIIMKGAASNHNTITNCVVDNNNDAGLQITGGAHDNTVQGSESFDNYDIGTKGSNADGFACKLQAGAGNKFINCNSHDNSDDGWDLLGTDETVTLINCTATKNGYYHGDPNSTLNNAGMNGDGIKLGGNQKPPKGTHRSLGSHDVEGCKSYDNKAAGFSQNNSAANLYLKDCDADRNGADNVLNANQKTTKSNFNFPFNPNNGNVFTFENCTTTGKCTIYSGAKVIGGNVYATAPNNPLPPVSAKSKGKK